MLPFRYVTIIQIETEVFYTMKLSAGKFAKEVGVTTPTVTRAIENGEITAEKKPKGGYLIDASELDRFMANRKTKPNDTGETLQTDTGNNISALQREVELLREAMRDKDSTIAADSGAAYRYDRSSQK